MKIGYAVIAAVLGVLGSMIYFVWRFDGVVTLFAVLGGAWIVVILVNVVMQAYLLRTLAKLPSDEREEFFDGDDGLVLRARFDGSYRRDFWWLPIQLLIFAVLFFAMPFGIVVLFFGRVTNGLFPVLVFFALLGLGAISTLKIRRRMARAYRCRTCLRHLVQLPTSDLMFRCSSCELLWATGDDTSFV